VHVGFSTGHRSSTRRSRLRGIQSAERDEDLGLGRRQRLAVAEADDARVLEEAAADHAPDPDVLAQARHAGPQAAMPRTTRIDLHAGLRGQRKPIDQLAVDQGIELGPYRGGAAALALAISASIRL